MGAAITLWQSESPTIRPRPRRASVVNMMTQAVSSAHLPADALFCSVTMFDEFCDRRSIAEEDADRMMVYGLASLRATAPDVALPVDDDTCIHVENARAELLEEQRATEGRETGTYNVHDFLKWLHMVNGAHPQLVHTACYIAELSLLEYPMLHCVSPSTLAEACVAYASLLFDDRHRFADALMPVVRYLAELYKAVHEAFVNGAPYAATIKYLTCTYGGVAALEPVSV